MKIQFITKKIVINYERPAPSVTSERGAFNKQLIIFPSVFVYPLLDNTLYRKIENFIFENSKKKVFFRYETKVNSYCTSSYFKFFG